MAEDEEVDESGTCGDKATWTLEGTNRELTLTISGNGEMYDYEENEDQSAPWRLNRGKISRIVIEDGINSIGNNAFRNCGILTEITIPDSVVRIGRGAFSSCSNSTAQQDIRFTETASIFLQRQHWK